MSKTAQPELKLTFETTTNRQLITSLLRPRWGETLLMLGKIWRLGEYDVMLARFESGEIAGFSAFKIEKSMVMIFSIDNVSAIKGVGQALINHISDLGREANARTMRVLMSNDNTPSLRYFQLRGFRIAALYPGAISMYRSLVPTALEFGVDGIPVRDAIELEIDL